MEKIICCSTVIFTTLFTASYLGFGIANAYVSSHNTGAKNECGAAIWYCNVMMAVLNFVAFIGMSIYLCSIKTSDNTSSGDSKNKSSGCSIVALGINIWACVAYFSIDSECKNFYLANYPQVWYMLEANVIYLFVSLGAIISMYVTTICLVLYAPRNSANI